MQPRFTGIIPPLVTPLTARDQLDHDGLARLIEHVLAGGVSGLFLLGTTGEAPSLSYRLRHELITTACQQVAGRVPVLVGVTDTSFTESLRVADWAANAGAAAVVLATPYYFPAGQTELTGYLQRLVPELPLPVMLYNMPSLTKVWFEPETLRQVAELPEIVGIKDSSGDLSYFRRLIELKQQRPDWSIFIGPEALLAEAFTCGGDGGVSGGANIFPELFVEWDRALRTQDHSAAAQYAQRVQLLQQIYEIGKYPSRFIKATKCSLSLRGICDDCMAEPFDRFKPPERERVRQILEQLQPPTERVSP